MYNSNNFLVDRQFGEKYEQFIARAFGGKWNKTDCDDEGIDVIVKQYIDIDDLDEWYIDVKAYQKPLFKKNFDGFYIETMIETEKKHEHHAGLYLNPKKTTHFALLKNCHSDKVEFAVCYIITPKALCEAVEEAKKDGVLQEKNCVNSFGYILPYEYVEKHCMMKATYKDMKKEIEQYDGQTRKNSSC